MKAFIFFIYLCIVLPTAFGQERPVRQLSPDKKHQVGASMVSKGSYYNAVGHMLELVEAHPGNKKYVLELANAYFFSRDYKNAEKWYKKHVDMDGDKVTTIALFRYAECLKYNEKYKEAENAFRKFAQSKYRDARKENYKKIAENEIVSCQWAQKNFTQINPYKVAHLGDNVNSAYSDFAPTLLSDSVLIYSSLQSDTVLTVEPDEAHHYMVKLYSSGYDGQTWGPNSLLPNVNTRFENNANGSFSPDKKRFYFTRCTEDADGDMLCHIYMSNYENERFSKPKKLPASINRKGYTSTQPHISLVENKGNKYEVLFYTSNRPGGRGGLDIWCAVIDPRGGYRAPANLGKDINTLRDEITPYYDSTSGNLYFSSNYHYGFGGYDIFRSQGAFNIWTAPVNMGKPLNTRVDDSYFSIRGDRNAGFLVSNRPEGYHLTSETCCDDIYEYSFNNDLMLAKLNAYAGKEAKVPLKDAVIRLFEKPSLQFPESAYRKDDEYAFNGDSVQHTVRLSADSASALNKAIINNLMRSGSKPVPARENTLIQAGRYKELPSADNSYLIDPDKAYIGAAVYDKDTVLLLFRSAPQKILSKTFATDDHSTARQEIRTRDFSLAVIDFYFDKTQAADSSVTALATETEAGNTVNDIESEHSHTVSKLYKELEAQKTRTLSKDIPIKEYSGELKIVLNYDFDDTKFIEKNSGSLDSLARLLTRYPELTIFIAAHTDSKGSEEYNLSLSKKRYRAIIDYMAKKGISRKRMSGQGYGESEPLVPNENPDGSDNPENRWLNRRAVITIMEN